MSPSLAALVALQALDSAIDHARKRLAEMPGVEQTLAARIAASTAAVEAAKARLNEGTTARRALEKDVATVDGRLARFDDHKAAVKTNQEYTALLHEISGAKAEKDALEERILLLMEEADSLAQAVKTAETARAKVAADADVTRIALHKEKSDLEAQLAALSADRARQAKTADPRALATYEQLLKGRRGVAVAKMVGSICQACHVRLRPAIEQLVRRNETLLQCDSCQRILYAPAPADAAAPTSDAQAPGGADAAGGSQNSASR